MRLILVFIVSLVPGILWVWFFHRKDRFEKEPMRLIAKTFLYGSLAVIPAALFESPFRGLILEQTDLFTQLWLSFLVIGLGEEFFKLLAVILAVYHSRELNEPVDAILYGATVGIGFSVVENMLYTATFGLEIAPIRALIATLAHASFTGLLGVYIGRAKFSDHPVRNIAIGLGLAAGLHGLYDFILLSRIVSPLVAIALIGAIYYILQQQIQVALDLSPFKHDDLE